MDVIFKKIVSMIRLVNIC